MVEEKIIFSNLTVRERIRLGLEDNHEPRVRCYPYDPSSTPTTDPSVIQNPDQINSEQLIPVALRPLKEQGQ